MDKYCGKKKSLTFMAGASSSLAFLLLTGSVATDFWLYTFERGVYGNGTMMIIMNSGLWRECRSYRYLPHVSAKTIWSEEMILLPARVDNCSFIQYFKSKPESGGDLKPSESVIYDMRSAAFFPLGGLTLLMIGILVSFISFCDRKTRLLIFTGGSMFVLSGISILIGIVLYVGSISQSFDSKSGTLETESKFVYMYGNSFFLSMVAFVLCEFSGIFSIYLYIAKHRHHLHTKQIYIRQAIESSSRLEGGNTPRNISGVGSHTILSAFESNYSPGSLRGSQAEVSVKTNFTGSTSTHKPYNAMTSSPPRWNIKENNVDNVKVHSQPKNMDVKRFISNVNDHHQMNSSYTEIGLRGDDIHEGMTHPSERHYQPFSHNAHDSIGQTIPVSPIFSTSTRPSKLNQLLMRRDKGKQQCATSYDSPKVPKHETSFSSNMLRKNFSNHPIPQPPTLRRPCTLGEQMKCSRAACSCSMGSLISLSTSRIPYPSNPCNIPIPTHLPMETHYLSHDFETGIIHKSMNTFDPTRRQMERRLPSQYTMAQSEEIETLSTAADMPPPDDSGSGGIYSKKVTAV